MTAYDLMWKEIQEYYRGKRCLITGSAGFIGGTLSRKLVELAAIPIGMDNRLGGKDFASVMNPLQVEHVFRGEPDIVFHLAGETEVGKSYREPALFYKTNIQGTVNVLEQCREIRGIKSIVVASTDKVYGLAPVPYKEEMQLDRCTNPYAASKQYADRIAQDYARFYDLPVRILRCCNVYGPSQLNTTTLITSAILNILNGKKARVSKANHEREWLYIDDCVCAYLLLGMLRDTDMRIYNVGSGETLRPIDVVSKIIGILGAGDYDIVPDNPYLTDFNQRVDSSSFRYDFPNYKTMGMDEGLSKTVEWYKEWVAKERGNVVV